MTTTEAASLAAVAPSTIKRWADEGLLPALRTRGGHRRFARLAVERLVEQMAGREGLPASGLVQALLGARRYEIDGRLLEARGRLGSWARVADEVGEALVALGKGWADGRVTVAEEHLAAEALTRALGRIGDAMPLGDEGPRCVLACAADDDHTLGLALAELCLRERGWVPHWLGRRTPVEEVLRVVRSRPTAMVALSASAYSADPAPLLALAEAVGGACRDHGVALVLGGAGAWPERPRAGLRLRSFAEFGKHLATVGEGI